MSPVRPQQKLCFRKRFYKKKDIVGKSSIQECPHVILKIHASIANLPTPASKGHFQEHKRTTADSINILVARLP